MNLGQIKTRIKRQFGDEAQVQVTDDDITSWVNEAVRHIVTKNESLLQKITFFDAVKDQVDYGLPGDLFLLRSINFKYYEYYAHLRNLDLTKFNEYMDGWDGNTNNTGKPQIYTIYAGTLKLFPSCDKDITDGIKIYYSRLPIEVVADEDIPDLPAEYYNTVLSYVMQQAYELDEDWEAVKNKQQQVQADILVNRSRQDRESMETYPVISTMREDMWYA